MKKIITFIGTFWKNFWYKSYMVNNLKIGSNLPQEWKTFQWQKLFNIVIIFLILLLIIILI